MIGPRVGLAVGPRVGPAAGISADELSAAGVTRDALSGIAVPASAAEWSLVMAAAGIATGGPSSLWLCQEASGNLGDSIASVSLAVTGSPAFQAAVTGWSRKGVTYPVSTTARHTNTTNAPDAGATSLMMLQYVSPPSADVGLVRGISQLGTTVEQRCNSGSPTRLTNVNGATIAGVAAFLGASVRPLVLKYNRTATTVMSYSDTEKITGTYAAATGPMVGMPPNAMQSLGFTCLYAALWSGAAAELSDAQVKTLLQALGFSIPWS